jgi:hypothetical protein
VVKLKELTLIPVKLRYHGKFSAANTKLYTIWNVIVVLVFSSYLHCEWKTAEELERGDKRIQQKVKRYIMKKSQNQNMFSEVKHL